MAKDKSLVKALIFSIFGDEGPVPEVTIVQEDDGYRIYKKESIRERRGPDVSHGLDYGALLQISMKSISLLMGEHTYQDGESSEKVRYFGILPFPDLKMEGLTYFFLIPDEKARGNARASTLTILVDERNKSFFYDFMDDLRIIIIEKAKNLDRMHDIETFSSIVLDLLNEINNFINQLSYPISIDRNVKIIFAGLDNSGKTSMILGLERKFSKLINIRPTQGVARHQSVITGMSVSVWDMGGQQKYRENYLKDAELYLFDCDLVFFLIDIKDEKRYDEAINYLSQITRILNDFEEHPPIIVCFHKMDPDSEQTLKENTEPLKSRILSTSDEFMIKFFETTIFEPYSLVTAFSYGIAMLNPNKEIFDVQLENFAYHSNAKGIILVNERGMLVSKFTVNDEINRFSDAIAHLLVTLLKNATNTVQGFNNVRNALLKIKDTKIIIELLKYDRFKLYFIAIGDSEMSIKEVEEALPDFKRNVLDLFEQYY